MANVVPIPRKPTKRTARPKIVHQFLVVLSGTNPLVWRRIQVPEQYTFWDLHVAIQDAMGWLDYHLHEFRLGRLRGSDGGVPVLEEGVVHVSIRASVSVGRTRTAAEPRRESSGSPRVGDSASSLRQLR